MRTLLKYHQVLEMKKEPASYIKVGKLSCNIYFMIICTMANKLQLPNKTQLSAVAIIEKNSYEILDPVVFYLP